MARNSEARKRYEEQQREQYRAEHFDDPFVIFGHRGEILVRCNVLGCGTWWKVQPETRKPINLCPTHDEMWRKQKSDAIPT